MTISSQPLSGPSLEILRDNRGGDDGRGQGRRVGDEEIVDEERKEKYDAQKFSYYIVTTEQNPKQEN